MSRLPHARVRLTFLSRDAGGRKSLPSSAALRSFGYRPHIVIGDPNQREVRLDVLSKAQVFREGDGAYLGVAFTDVDREPKVGEPLIAEVTFMYFPRTTYRDASQGATFTLREGLRIIGFGEILEVVEKEVKQANQLPDPTSPSVTRPAGAGHAPSVAADH